MTMNQVKEIYLDFNPANEFWVHKELKDEPDADFIILTYKDNEALDESIVRQIEKNRDKAATSSYWANWWRVYGLGEVGMLEGVIFDFHLLPSFYIFSWTLSGRFCRLECR